MPMAAGNRAYVRRGQRPPVFAAWLAIKSRGPICGRWRSFGNFYADVGPRPSWRHLLIRDDPTGAFEPGNARWRIAARYRLVRPTTRSRMRNGMIQINAAARLPPKEFAQ
jgi:hypothetical protein